MKKNAVKEAARLYMQHKKAFVAVIVANILMSANDLVPPLVINWLAEQLGLEKTLAMRALVTSALVLIVCMAVAAITDYFSIVVASVMTDQIKANIQIRLFDHFNRMQFKYHDENKTGATMSIMDVDTSRADELIYRIPTNLVRIACAIIGASIVFTKLNPKLFMVSVPILPLLLVINMASVKISAKKSAALRQKDRDMSSFVEDKLNGVRTVVSFGKEDEELEIYKSILSDRNKTAVAKWTHMYFYRSGSDLLVNIYYFVIAIVGGIFVLNGDISVTDMLVFYMYAHKMLNPFCEIASLSRDMSENISSFSKIVEVLSEESTIRNSKNCVKPEIKGAIDFNNVSFSYNEENGTVLNTINMHIKQGEYIAIVGPSGSGKSTIAGLIPRFYDIDNGSICIDGTNVKDIDLQYLRKSVGIVQQDIYLFNGTAYDNIAYGNRNATMEQVIEAAKLANAHEFISQLPDGYNSDIGQRGIKLSGGQKQRIAIARLFLANPQIMIFDEATSALDNKSEKAVQEALERLAKNRTTIVIAHRLSTIQNADRIMLLTENGIEESGTHDKLMKMNGKYAALYAAK